METSNVREKAENVSRKVFKLMYSPKVRMLSRFATSVLETVSIVDTKNPISVATGLASLLDSGVEAFDIPLPTKIEQYGESHSLIERISYLGSIVVSSGLLDEMQPKVVCMDGKVVLKELAFDFGRFFYVENTDSATQVDDELDRIHGYYYTTQNFPFEKLFDKIWSRYKDGIYLSIKSTIEEGSDIRDIRMHKLSISDLAYISQEPNLEKFCKELARYRAKNISRSYMLIGDPGMGKTSYAVLASKSFTRRILKIDPGVSQHLGSGEFDFIIQNLHPEVIIFDDFDQAVDSKHLLFALEMIKQQFPNITIFATVNDFEGLDPAIKRPGRIDKRIWFDLPSETDRRNVLLFYLEKFKVTFTEDQLTTLMNNTDKMSPAYIRELCVRLDTDGWEGLEDIIIEFKRTLNSPEEIEEDES